MAVLPPGVSSESFTAATRAFAASVGEEWVFTSDEDLVPYRDYWSPVPREEDELLPSAAVAPASVEQVQSIVRTANQYRTPSDLDRQELCAGRRRACAVASSST